MDAKQSLILDDFYLLSDFCNNDLEVVANLIEFVSKEKSKTRSDLEALKINKYAMQIEIILDTLTPQTIRNLAKLHTNQRRGFIMQEMNAKQREFITLRADGMSYDNIAAKLKTAKSTLIQWAKLFEDDIKELQFFAMVAIKEAYRSSTKRKYETLLKQLDKIDDAILDADLSTTALKDLYTVKNVMLAQIENIEGKTVADARLTRTDEMGYKEQLKVRLNEVD